MNGKDFPRHREHKMIKDIRAIRVDDEVKKQTLINLKCLSCQVIFGELKPFQTLSS